MAFRDRTKDTFINENRSFSAALIRYEAQNKEL